MLAYRKRLRHWFAVVLQFCNAEPPHRRAQALAVAVWRMLRAIVSGPVPADVWRNRVRKCGRCPVRSDDWVCFRQLSDGRMLGCRCDLAFLCLSAAPYPKGCWAHEITEHEGWPAYRYPSRWAKIRAFFRFIRGKPS
jgi:hypothetical protein